MRQLSLGLWLLWISGVVMAEAPFVLNIIGGTANAINALGQVIGTSDGKAYIYTAGVKNFLDALIDINSQAFGINDKGDIVGQFRKGGIDQAFLYRGGELIEIAPSLSTSVALDINNQGYVVGYMINPLGMEVAFYYDGDFLPLGTLDNGGHSRAYAINDQGDIVGMAVDAQGMSRAVRFHGGLIEPLALGNDNQFSEARDINQHGHIVGTAMFEGIQQAFVLIDDKVTYLGTLGGDSSMAYAINASGHIVGQANSLAFLYTPETGMIDLHSLVGNVSLRIATDINDRGQIAVDSHRIDRPQHIAKHIATIAPTNGESNQRFGYTMAIHNQSEFLIGSMASNTAPITIYQFNNPLDIPELPLPLEGYHSFPSLTVDNDTAVIGSWSSGCCGEVYLFIYQDGVWQANGMLSSPDDLKDGDRFGSMIRLSQDTLVVAAPYSDNDDGSENSGSVYFYQRNEANIWELQYKLTAPQPAANAYFGTQLAIDNDQLVITEIKSLYFYQQAATTWATTPYYQINWSNIRRSQYLLLQDNVLVIGDTTDNDSVGLYQRTDNTWKQTASIKPSGAQSWSNFSSAIALQNNHLFVGDQGSNTPSRPGGVYHFQKIGDLWIELEKILPPDPTQVTQFGQSLAIANNLLIVGAPGDYHLGLKTGVAHVYDLQLTHQTLDIGLTLNSLPDVTYNNPFTVSATVVNHDEENSASGIIITLPLTDSLAFDETTDQCELNFQTIQCYIDELAPQASTTLAITLRAGKLGALSITAKATPINIDPNPNNNEAEINLIVSPIGKPAITIVSPAEGEPFTHTVYEPLEFQLSIQNWSVSESGTHYHWFIDDQEQPEQYSRHRILWENAMDGPHVLKVQLVNADHSLLTNELAQASANFTVETAYPSIKITHPTPEQALGYDPSINHSATIELENWLLKPGGMHADWVLNADTEAEQSGHLHALEPIVLGALSVGDHTLEVRLVNAEDQATPYQSHVRFEVHELPPTLTINQPQADQNIGITADNPLLIELSTKYWQITPEGRRYRWQWDEQYQGEASELPLNLSEKLTDEALTDGPHTLIITLIHADGSVQGTEASVDFSIHHPVNLSLGLAFDVEQARRSDPLILNVTVNNLSQQNAASEVKVTVPIPSGTTYRNSPDYCQYDDSANQVQCVIPQILAQSQQTIAIELLVDTAEEITAQASVIVVGATSDLDPEIQQAQSSIVSQDPVDLAITTFVDPASDRHRVNAPLQVTFRLSNQHPNHQANQIELNISLPNPLQVQGDYSPCLYNPDQHLLTCPMEPLAANSQHDIPLSFIPVAATEDPVILQAEVTHRSAQVELTPKDNQTDMTLDFYQPSLTIIKPEAEENMELAGPETVQLLFKVAQWLFDPQQTVQLLVNDQFLREFKPTDVNQGSFSHSISGLSTGSHQLTLVPQQNDERFTDEAQTVSFHVNYARPTTEPPSLSILTPDDQSTLYIDSHRTIKVDYRIDHWQYKEQTPHRWFLMKKDENNEAVEKPLTVQYHSVNQLAPLQFTESDLTLDTTYILTVELTDINGVPTGISDQITFTVKKVEDTPETPTTKKSGGQLQLSGLLCLLLWLLGCRLSGVHAFPHVKLKKNL